MTEELFTIIWIICSICFIGFFAGYEVAFISANRLSIELKKKQGKKSGIILSHLMEQPNAFVGSCLIGLNLFIVIYGLLFDRLFDESFWKKYHINSPVIRLVIDTFFSASVVLVFGEFFPRAVFKARHNKVLFSWAWFANLFHSIFAPITVFFVGLSHWVLTYIFNLRVRDKANLFNKVDLEHFFQQTKEQEEDSQELNTELFENALSLPMIKIRQCLVPRTEIECIDISESIEDARQQFIQTKLSKLIVYEDNIDNILGYIHQLDLFKKPFSIRDILLPIPAVPESMSATDLINKFTKLGKSIAWVVDEFGGTSGIITMEDLLEEIFGEIKDEYDTEDFVDKQLASDEYIFSGRLELDFLNEKYNLEFPEKSSETLSGYIINKFEEIPKLKEQIIINDYQFDILNVSETRIEMVKMKVLR